MLTPFASEFAKKHILELLELSKDLDLDIAKCTNKSDFQSILPWCSDEKKDREDFPDLSDEQIQELMDDESVDAECGYEVWVSACLYDAILNGTDYAPYCSGYAEEYQKAVEALRKSLAKKKFLSKKPVHDLPEILQNAIDALDYVLGVGNDSELAEEMSKSGTLAVWEEEIIDLQNRLSKHIP